MVIHAVIMAGGSGTRLRPLTCDLPKPMVPVLNRPVMSYTVDLLKKHGVENIAVTLAYLPGKVRDYFGNGAQLGVSLEYYIEDTPLGTAGSVMNTGDFIRETFMVISGDALTDLDIDGALAFHRQRGSQATLILHRQPVPLEYGVVITDKDGRITRFLEKPSWGEVFSDTVNTGIYILEPSVMEYCPRGEKFDFSKDLFPRLLKDGIPMYGYVTQGYWCDIGDLSSYRQAGFDVMAGRVNVQIAAPQVQRGIWMGEDCILGDNVQLEGPVFLGRGCTLGQGAYLGPYTVLGDGCRVEAGASLKRTVVWKHSRLGRECEARGATVGSNVSLGANVRLFEDAVVGNGTLLEEGVTVRPGIKVWPGKTISGETEVSSHLVWGSRRNRRLFGFRDMSGVFNVEVTPEFSSRVGSAFTALAGPEKCVLVTSDHTRAAALVAESLSVGVLACGARVIRGSGLAVPMTRYAVNHYGAGGGIHVRMDAFHEDRVRLEFMDAQGVNLNRAGERKLEAAFNSDDYQRAAADAIDLIERSEEIIRLYFDWAERDLRVLGPGKSGPRVVVGAESEHMAFLGASFLARIGCTVKRGGHSVAAVSAGVKELAAGIGIFFRADGEEIVLVDEDGTLVRDEGYRALATWLAVQTPGQSIVIPHSSSQVLRDIAAKAEIIPVRSAPGEVMAEMQRRRHKDRRIDIQYLLYFDALQAAARIIDYLESKQLSLAQIVAELPDLHFKELALPCHWRDKGRVLRELAAQYRPEQMEMDEGIRILDDKGWALVLPDSEKPQFKIYAQGYSAEFAEELAVQFTDKVLSLLKEEHGRQ